MNHPNIIKLVDVIENEIELSMVLEYANAGEIFDVILKQGPFSESQVSKIIQQLLSALKHMHSMGFVHRDLKPENVLMSRLEDGQLIVKLADFGLSKDFEDDVLMTFCGTPDYVAPEVIAGEVYTHSVDIWSLGVLTYTLLCGTTPFGADKSSEIFEKIRNADYNFKAPEWNNISSLSKDIISRMLKIDPEERLDAEAYLDHPWIKEFTKKEDTTPTVPLKSFDQKLFAAYRIVRDSQRREIHSSTNSIRQTMEKESGSPPQEEVKQN